MPLYNPTSAAAASTLLASYQAAGSAADNELLVTSGLGPLSLRYDALSTASDSTTVGLRLRNGTTGSVQNSPGLTWEGAVAGGTIQWKSQLLPGGGGNTNDLTFSQSTFGGSYVNVLTVRYDFGEAVILGGNSTTHYYNNGGLGLTISGSGATARAIYNIPLKYNDGSYFQTTVGAAGGAAAPPATPVTYATFTANNGVDYVFALYAKS